MTVEMAFAACRFCGRLSIDPHEQSCPLTPDPHDPPELLVDPWDTDHAEDRYLEAMIGEPGGSW